MVFDTLILESKANSVDICIHINNKIVQYKYKDSVCVRAYVCVVYECRIECEHVSLCVCVCVCVRLRASVRTGQGD